MPLPHRAVRALAHPLRSRLVATLRTEGPATATDLARALGTNSGATSYHLRRLAEDGVVVEQDAPGGRRRVWAASPALDHVRPGDVLDDTDAETALGWLERDWLAHFTDKLGAWLDRRHRWPRGWQDATGLHDRMIVVTDVQLAELQERVAELVESYTTVGQGNPEAKRVNYSFTAYPIDLDKAPRR